MNETGRRAGGRAPPRPDERHGAGDEAMRAKGFDDDVRLAGALGKTHGGGSAADAAADAGATRYPVCPHAAVRRRYAGSRRAQTAGSRRWRRRRRRRG